VAALEAAFLAERWNGPARSHLAVPGGELLLMPAAAAQGVGVNLVACARQCLADADIVGTCTRAASRCSTPRRCRPARTSIRSAPTGGDVRELPAEGLCRALLVVETRESALLEAGDVLLAIADGALAEHHVRHDLAAVARGTVRRQNREQVTIFKSVGLALEDLAIAAAASRRLRASAPSGVPAASNT
jgi:ornithine cyclodeaminase/alanine dehydrogenase-like protein (mu-crystallin family)